MSELHSMLPTMILMVVLLLVIAKLAFSSDRSFDKSVNQAATNHLSDAADRRSGKERRLVSRTEADRRELSAVLR